MAAVLGVLALVLLVTLAGLSGVSFAANSTVTTVPAARPAPPNIAGQAAILINPDDGRVLYEKNADQRRAMASTTKIMTALLVMEHLNYDATVTVSKLAADVGESEMLLDPGEVVTVEELLYGILVMSGNDAATAGAEAVAGSVDAFVKMMNQRATELGLANTHFVNPHGLDASGHYSSARDLAKLGAYAMKNPNFAKIAGTARIEFPWPGHSSNRVMINHNKLLGAVPYITGVKTGFTNKAGFCLVASASKDGVDLVSVVLGATTNDQCNQDTLKLMDYGFSFYRQQTLVEKNAVLASIPIPYHIERRLPLVAANSLERAVYIDDVVSKSIEIPTVSPMPVQQGEVLGKISFFVGEREIGSVPLLAGESIQRPTLGVKLSYFWARFRQWVGGLFS